MKTTTKILIVAVLSLFLATVAAESKAWSGGPYGGKIYSGHSHFKYGHKGNYGTVISTTGTTDITLPVRVILEADTSHTTGTVASMVFLMGAVSTTITVTVTTGTTFIHMVAANIMSLTKTPRTPQSVERISTG
jgi:hypothetical protein